MTRLPPLGERVLGVTPDFDSHGQIASYKWRIIWRHGGADNTNPELWFWDSESHMYDAEQVKGWEPLPPVPDVET